MKTLVSVLSLVPLIWALVYSQSPSASPGADPTILCRQLSERSDSFDRLIYSSYGLGGALSAEAINFTRVEGLLAPNFSWEDYSLFPSFGNYADPRKYVSALNSNNVTYPYVRTAILEWRSCDPVNRRLVSQWIEPFGLASNPNATVNSTSIYITEFASNLAILRQAYWTSGNLANLTRPIPTPSSHACH